MSGFGTRLAGTEQIPHQPRDALERTLRPDHSEIEQTNLHFDHPTPNDDVGLDSCCEIPFRPGSVRYIRSSGRERAKVPAARSGSRGWRSNGSNAFFAPPRSSPPSIAPRPRGRGACADERRIVAGDGGQTGIVTSVRVPGRVVRRGRCIAGAKRVEFLPFDPVREAGSRTDNARHARMFVDEPRGAGGDAGGRMVTRALIQSPLGSKLLDTRAVRNSYTAR